MMIPQMLGISEKSLLIGQLYGNELKNIIMKGISDFSSSKLLAKVSLASGGGAPEMDKLLVTQKNSPKIFFPARLLT